MRYGNTRVVRSWKFSGGRIGLDFVNSVGGRSPGNGRISTILGERLRTYSDLVDWADARGILTNTEAKDLLKMSPEKKREGQHVLDRAVALRESLFRIFKGSSEGLKPLAADIGILNKESSRARDRQKLVYTAGRFVLTFEPVNSRLDSMLWPVAINGADLLLSGDLSRIHQCPGTDCGWLFYDESRNGSRQWCDMRTCGTLEKVRRYRERQKSA